MGTGIRNDELSRRAAMKTALKAGAYAAPVVLSSVVPAAVSAASPPGTGATLTATIRQAAITPTIYQAEDMTKLRNGIPNHTFDVYVSPNTANPPGTFFLIGELITDILGNGDHDGSTFVDILLGLPPGGYEESLVNQGANPTPPIYSTTVSGSNLTTGPFLGIVSGTITQKPTTATCAGTAAQYVETATLKLAYKEAHESLDLYLRPDNSATGAFVFLGTATTDVYGGGKFTATVTVTTKTAIYPKSVTINVVAKGGSPLSPIATDTLTSVQNLPC